MRVCYTNKLDDSQVVLQPEEENSDFPIENVQDQRLSTYWKSTDGSTQSIIVDLGKRSTVDTVAILGHNFDSDSVVTVEGSDSILTSSSGSMIWATILNPSQTTVYPILYNSGIMMTFITSTSRRYWRLKPTKVLSSTYTADLRAVKWIPELGIFVAISYSAGVVLTSTDGIKWIPHTAPEKNTLQGLAWSPELSLLVAVATDGTNRVMTSPDGVTWTARAVTTEVWFDVQWSSELGIFCAVGGGVCMTSTNGITWTARTGAGVVSEGVWLALVWSSELSLFVAVTNTINAGGFYVMTSPDGSIWTGRTASEAGRWEKVCWSPKLGLFVATATATAINRTMSSSDGINWEGHTITSASWEEVCWSPELAIFCAVASNNFYIAISSDGKNWTVAANAASANLWYRVCWSSALRLFVATGGGTTSVPNIMTSPDGVTWTLASTSLVPIQIARIWLGEYVTIDPSSLLDFKVTEKNSDTVIYGKNRQKFALPGVSWRQFEFTFPPTANAMIEKISTMIDTVGTFNSFIFCNFDTISANYPIISPCYCSLSGEIEFSHTESMKMNYSLNLEEDL